MHNILAAELMKLKKNKMAGTGTLLLCAIPVLAMIKKILIDKDSIGLQEWYLTIFLLQTIAPVSYTHLDVYKRQIRDGSGFPVRREKMVRFSFAVMWG